MSESSKKYMKIVLNNEDTRIKGRIFNKLKEQTKGGGT